VRYHAVVGGSERLVVVTAHGSSYRIAIHPGPIESPGAPPRVLDIDAVHVHARALSLLAGTRSARCDIQTDAEGGFRVLLGEEVYALHLLDDRHHRMRKAGGSFSLEGPQRIDAPMPGKVVRVLVREGDSVHEGQGLVVVEAMKMENELRSPKAGVVKELHAQEGQPVEAGAKLAVVA
jgi:biotin carboxyl carrier protein